jgi:hypothetical protein
MLHKHHVLPKRLGGGDEIVLLTIPEHAEAHRILWERHGQWQDYVAWKALSGQITNIEASRKAMSEGGKCHKGKKRPIEIGQKVARFHRRRNRSVETRERIGAARKGKTFRLSDEVYAKIAESNRGKKRTAAQRARLSAARRASNHAVHAGPLSPEWREAISRARKSFIEQNISELRCIECGNKFMHWSPISKFCSGACKTRNWRRRHRDS